MTRLARPGGSLPTPRSVDVARPAGVSQKTVSRILNDEPYVSADVRRWVLDAAEELDCAVGKAHNAHASSLAAITV
jgi:DNA-binding LacI/PurR family transcriptional regulator